MRIDSQYMSELLNKMLDAKTPTFTLWNLADIANFMMASRTTEERDKFVFHMEILHDDGFIDTARITDDYVGIGIVRQKDGSYIYSTVPLRLTASGHRCARELLGRTLSLDKEN